MYFLRSTVKCTSKAEVTKRKKDLKRLIETSCNFVHLIWLEPQCAGVLEHSLERAAEVVGHDGVGRPDELPPDEDGGDGRAAAEPSQGPLHLLPSRVLVELVDGRAHTELVEQALHCMAHAARALAEYHHRLLRRQLRYPVHRLMYRTRR
ncbi:hypothetical protein EUGRSUZ_H03859 [Eucalyptus grandis]|uniref:Uncharacterized protein n=2 Tax=Eucalyptus grandis TaxID=71139 RepID=A0ACC3JUT5_EUCGR|nr:hypothetical protein EUGRSUZ_H03859 [Eucalyptus grandis]